MDAEGFLSSIFFCLVVDATGRHIEFNSWGASLRVLLGLSGDAIKEKLRGVPG